MAVLHISYLSMQLQRTVPLTVILPLEKMDGKTSGYQKNKKFKTLYLLHGYLGSNDDWLYGTRIEMWAREKNLCVVMPSGENGFYLDHEYNNYGRFIGEELIEVTRAMLPLSKKREDTFIGGLSMGGYGALRNGLKYKDTFSRIIALSSAVSMFSRADSSIRHQDTFGSYEESVNSDKNIYHIIKSTEDKTSLPSIYLAVGKQDFLYEDNHEFKEFLEKEKVDFVYVEEEGAHEWYFWDRQILAALQWLPLDK